MSRTTPTARTNATLDPDDWNEFRALAHRMVDDSLDFLRTLPDRPAWTPLPADVRTALASEAVPHEPQGEAQVYEEFLAHVLPWSNGSRSPQFFGWVQGNGTPLGMMADMLASGMNPHMAGFNDAPRVVEERVIAWLAELMGFPATSGGLLMSGGTMANYLGLAVARHAKAGYDVRAHGVFGGPRLTVYASTEVHSWAQKCLELLGLGHASLRKVAVDDDFRVDVAAMRAMIAADRAGGARHGARRFACLRPAQVGLPALRDRVRAGARRRGAARRLLAHAELPARRGARRHCRRSHLCRPWPRADARLQGAEGVDVVQGARRGCHRRHH
ncbi:MAG: hypothetical protein C0497_11520 [Gemmatimonas sp.]|nr:hypothetical protein [Gemmatimonas sp.]